MDLEVLPQQTLATLVAESPKGLQANNQDLGVYLLLCRVRQLREVVLLLGHPIQISAIGFQIGLNTENSDL